MNIVREQISFPPQRSADPPLAERQSELTLQFAPGTNKSQIEALQKFFPHSAIKQEKK